MESQKRLYEIASVQELCDETITQLSAEVRTLTVEQVDVDVGYTCPICRIEVASPTKNACGHYVCSKCEKPTTASCSMCH
jgi:uncharacterized protein (UPF0212 family)